MFLPLTLSMPINKNVYYGLGAFALLLLLSKSSSGANTSAGAMNLLSIAGEDTDDLDRLNNLYGAMLANGTLNNFQIQLMLAQCLLETGLFVDGGTNYTAIIDRNNWAGLTTTNGAWAEYDNLNDFVTAYIGFLKKGANPLGATSVTDFNNRLIANGYYGKDDPNTYLNNLNHYFNLLTSTYN